MSSPKEVAPTPGEGAVTVSEALPVDASVSDEATAAAFIQDALEGDKAAFTSTAELMAAARAWCAEKDEFRFGTKVLARRLRAAGCRQHSTGSHRGWKGVRLK